MERTSVFDTIKFRPGFGFFCFEQITVFQYFRDNSSIKYFELPLFFPRMEIYWFSVLGERASDTVLLDYVSKRSSNWFLEWHCPKSPRPIQIVEPCLDKHHEARFFFDATIMIYHVSLQTCFKCTMVYDKDESGHAPDQPHLFKKS